MIFGKKGEPWDLIGEDHNPCPITDPLFIQAQFEIIGASLKVKIIPGALRHHQIDDLGLALVILVKLTSLLLVHMDYLIFVPLVCVI
jgi:hypothetical protein